MRRMDDASDGESDMGTRIFNRFFLLFLVVAILGAALACSDSGSSKPDGDDDSSASDGDSYVECRLGVQRCDPDRPHMAQVCSNQRWEDLRDCSTIGQTCDEGDCVANGDEDAEEEEIDPGPTVLSTSPNPQEVVPATLVHIDIVFSTPVWTHPNVATRNLVKVETGGQRQSFLNEWIDRTGAVDYQGQERPLYRQLRLTLINPLIQGSVYTVTLAGGDIFDEENYEFRGYVFEFTVEGQPPADMDVEEVEDLLPEVEYTDPADGATVSTDRDYVLVAFSEPMKTYAFDLDTDLSWKGSDGTTLVFSADWQADKRSLSMALDASNWLQEGVTYTIRLEEGLMDEDNNPLGSYSFSFLAHDVIPDGDEEELEPEAEDEMEREEEAEADLPIPEMGVLESVESVGNGCMEDLPFETPHSLRAYWSSGKVIVLHSGDTYPDAACMNRPDYEFEQLQRALNLQESVDVETCTSGFCKRLFVYTIGSLFPARYTVAMETQQGSFLSDDVTVPYNITAMTSVSSASSGESTSFIALGSGFDAVHQGRSYNTGIWEVFVDVSIEGDTIELDEIPVYSGWNRSSAPLKIITEIRELSGGTYTVIYRYEGEEIYRDEVIVSTF